METKLYVGNLAYATTEAEIRQSFTKAGTVVAVNLIKDQDSGKSKGFAFVTMSTAAEAQAAIGLFHSARLAGRELTVNLAQNREKPAGTGARPKAPTGYQSRFSAFGASGITPTGGPRSSGKPKASGGYVSRYNAFGDQSDKPAAAPRRRGGSQRH